MSASTAALVSLPAQFPLFLRWRTCRRNGLASPPSTRTGTRPTNSLPSLSLLFDEPRWAAAYRLAVARRLVARPETAFGLSTADILGSPIAVSTTDGHDF